VLIAAVTLMLWMSALAGAGPLDTARVQEQKFDSAVLACKPDAAADLYADDAVAIYPGEGDFGIGRPEITKVLNTFSSAFCPNDVKRAALKDVRFAATPLGTDYILVLRIIDATDKAGNHAVFRMTKVLHRSGEKWWYLSDHTSLGIPAASDASDKGGQ
jgi:ketosteroid isomerase-like protein